MKYEFHVGDYVAVSNKCDILHGYVKYVTEYLKPAFSSEYCFVFQWDDGTQTGWCGRIEELPHIFIRIGQYDFTKKNKINSLICKQTNDYCNSKLMWDKINELVEAVNRLEEEVNGMA